MEDYYCWCLTLGHLAKLILGKLGFIWRKALILSGKKLVCPSLHLAGLEPILKWARHGWGKRPRQFLVWLFRNSGFGVFKRSGGVARIKGRWDWLVSPMKSTCAILFNYIFFSFFLACSPCRHVPVRAVPVFIS